MAWDTARTKRLLLDAAAEEFTAHGPEGGRVARIAQRAGVNKERIYQYFGSKDRLFVAALAQELGRVAGSVPLTEERLGDLGAYAGDIFDYHRARPHLLRLLSWEGLTYGDNLAAGPARERYYADKIAAVARAQQEGTVARRLAPEELVCVVIALTAFWSTLPQIASLLVGDDPGAERRVLVEVVRQITAPAGRHKPPHAAEDDLVPID